MTREEIAVRLMAGLMANPNIDTLENMADDAVIGADLLAKALAESEQPLPPKRPTGFVKPSADYFFRQRMLGGKCLGGSGY